MSPADTAIPRSASFPVLRLLADIKLAHTVFALPFALLGGALVIDLNTPPARLARLLTLVLVCMVGARTWAMVVNRLADHRIDARNPRTARRAIAAGEVRPAHALRLALFAAAVFLAGAAGFWAFDGNPWPIAWALPVLAWIAFYSFTKRFTALCHLVLGVALGLSPVAAAVAVAPELVLHTPALWLIALMVVLWVAGFDVIYALQDLDFDRDAKLHSIPARLGWQRALWVSRAMHAGAFAALTTAWLVDDRLGPVFGVAVVIVGALLVAEHLVLVRRGKDGLQMAFFTLNGVVSLVAGGLGILAIIIP